MDQTTLRIKAEQLKLTTKKEQTLFNDYFKAKKSTENTAKGIV